MEKLFNRKEAAALLRISIASLDNAKNAGEITYIQYKRNGSVFFTGEALSEYIAKATRRAVPAEQRVTYRKRRHPVA